MEAKELTTEACAAQTRFLLRRNDPAALAPSATPALRLVFCWKFEKRQAAGRV
jgi:hypothetical protein